jgi:hypothetical protein
LEEDDEIGAGKQTYRHCNEGSDLIDIGKHSDLRDNIRDANSIYGFIGLLRPLPEQGESGDEVVSSKCLQQLRRTNYAHQHREK